MTVTLAFKAFAKAIPCLTPFLATSDPSVLKRILAYIRGLPCSSNIFPKNGSDRRLPSTAIDNGAVDYGLQRLDVFDLLGRDREVIAIENDHVGQLTDLDRALDLLLET